MLPNLFITYSNQKSREISKSIVSTKDKVITLDSFVDKIFQDFSQNIDIEPTIAISFLYQTIEQKNIEYISFISKDSEMLNDIYSFLLKIDSSNIELSDILSGEKLQALEILYHSYQEFKTFHSLSDTNDKIRLAIQRIDNYPFEQFEKIYIDSFEEFGVNYYKSSLELELVELLQKRFKPLEFSKHNSSTNLYRLSKEPFDTTDEIQSALKLASKLFKEDNTLSPNDICIVTTDINEYAPLFRLYLSKYQLQGFDSKGIALNLFIGKKNQPQKVLNTLSAIKSEVKNIEEKSNRFGLSIDTKKLRKKLIDEQYILDDKIGVELTEANQLTRLNRVYKHIIFMGVDINHFPPQKKESFLYSSQIGEQYFCENNTYTSSLFQYNELKRLADNLYILYPEYKEKRKLAPSIIIDSEIPNSIDISDIKPLLNPIEPQSFLDSITSQEFTSYDGLEVENMSATHLSASQLSAYAKCPLKYLYTHKLKLYTPKESEEGFDVMEQGTLMHSCFEQFAREVQGKKELELEDFNSIMSKVLEREYQKFIIELSQKAKEQERYFSENIFHKLFKFTLKKEDGVLMKFIAEYDNSKERLEYFTHSEFEKEFALDNSLQPYTLKSKEDKEYFIKGYIDRFDNLQSIDIIDYKSKKANGVLQEKLQEIKEFKDFQLGLYTLYATQEYQKEVDAYLQSFKSDKSLSAKFARIATDEQMIPKNRGKESGVLYDNEYEESLKKNIYTIQDKIENGEFSFDSSDEKYCGYCEIRYMCNSGVLGKGLN